MQGDDEDTGRPGADTHALAAQLARGQAAGSRAAETYLREATRLARLQIEELREARSFGWLAHFSAAMKAAFEGLVAIAVLVVLIVVGAAVWNAAHDNSLVIESFSVPADLAARGLTGHVVAARLEDKLTRLQAATNSMRAAGSYQNNWGDDIQVQIPDTGVSLGQLNRYLHDWLGHRTYINGEIYRTGDRLTVTARIGSEPAQSISGKPADLDALLGKAAEAVYGKTQPYRYAVYLETSKRTGEAEAAYRRLIASGPPLERAWAWVGLGTIEQGRGNAAAVIADMKKALAIRPDFILAYINLDGTYSNLQHTEIAYRIERKLVGLLKAGAEPDINPAAIPSNTLQVESSIAAGRGDMLAAIAAAEKTAALPDYSGSADGARRSAVVLYAQAHDGAGLERMAASLAPPTGANSRLNRDAVIFIARSVIGDWAAARAMVPTVEADAKAMGPAARIFKARTLEPLNAYSLAMTGHLAEGRALAAKTPLDCDTCLRVRARIAMAAHDWKAAEHWAARCADRTPSLPACETDWGDILLAKGDLAGAIAKYRIAHARGPHFADPLEGWGEVLIAKNRSDLAIAKFAEADRYAPNWGRLHLKWGEALLWTGDHAGAQKQFETAAHLFLTAAERGELQRVEAEHV